MSCFTYSLGIYGHTKLVQLTTVFTAVESDIGTRGKVYGEIQSTDLSKGGKASPSSRSEQLKVIDTDFMPF